MRLLHWMPRVRAVCIRQPSGEAPVSFIVTQRVAYGSIIHQS